MPRFIYLVILMTFMMFLSHGTQDLFPDFLKEIHKITPKVVAISRSSITSEQSSARLFLDCFTSLGAAKGMIAALALSLVTIPFWAFGHGVYGLACAAFVMQMGVQGAWGVIPVHLTKCRRMPHAD